VSTASTCMPHPPWRERCAGLPLSKWQGRLTVVDLPALSPLKWQHVNPYGTLTMNMQERLSLEQVPWSPGATLPKFWALLG